MNRKQSEKILTSSNSKLQHALSSDEYMQYCDYMASQLRGSANQQVEWSNIMTVSSAIANAAMHLLDTQPGISGAETLVQVANKALSHMEASLEKENEAIWASRRHLSKIKAELAKKNPQPWVKYDSILLNAVVKNTPKATLQHTDWTSTRLQDKMKKLAEVEKALLTHEAGKDCVQQVINTVRTQAMDEVKALAAQYTIDDIDMLIRICKEIVYETKKKNATNHPTHEKLVQQMHVLDALHAKYTGTRLTHESIIPSVAIDIYTNLYCYELMRAACTNISNLVEKLQHEPQVQYLYNEAAHDALYNATIRLADKVHDDCAAIREMIPKSISDVILYCESTLYHDGLYHDDEYYRENYGTWEVAE